MSLARSLMLLNSQYDPRFTWVLGSNSIATSPEGPYSAQVLTLKYNCIVQVQYMDSYDEGAGVVSQRWGLLNPAVFEEARNTNRTLVCRLRLVGCTVDPRSTAFRVRPLSSIFIISPSPASVNVVDANASTATTQQIIENLSAGQGTATGGMADVLQSFMGTGFYGNIPRGAVMTALEYAKNIPFVEHITITELMDELWKGTVGSLPQQRVARLLSLDMSSNPSDENYASPPFGDLGSGTGQKY